MVMNIGTKRLFMIENQTSKEQTFNNLWWFFTKFEELTLDEQKRILTTLNSIILNSDKDIIYWIIRLSRNILPKISLELRDTYIEIFSSLIKMKNLHKQDFLNEFIDVLGFYLKQEDENSRKNKIISIIKKCWLSVKANNKNIIQFCETIESITPALPSRELIYFYENLSRYYSDNKQHLPNVVGECLNYTIYRLQKRLQKLRIIRDENCINCT